jgi:hypothetical protein
MTSEQGAVTQAVSRLVSRLEAKQQQQGQELTEKEALALRLNTQYPGGDVGVLSCFFLNLVSRVLMVIKTCTGSCSSKQALLPLSLSTARWCS